MSSWEKLLYERNLHLDTVFSSVCATIANGRAGIENGVRKLLIDGYFAQGRLP